VPKDPHRLFRCEVLHSDCLVVVNEPTRRAHLTALVKAQVKDAAFTSFRWLAIEDSELLGIAQEEVRQELYSEDFVGLKTASNLIAPIM
jgi:hypothetical protein